MNGSDKCRVDECDRRAAATIVRESLPGPLPLCAIHTEDFRLNSAGWVVIWEHTQPEPTSVRAAAEAGVGRNNSGPEDAPQPPERRGKSRLARWRSARS
jgi:hypothetical protein